MIGTQVVDPRVTRMAEVLVGHSTEITEGQAVLVWCYSELAKPLLVEICREAFRQGAGPIAWQVDYPEIEDAVTELASDDTLRRRNDLLLALAQHVDVTIRIQAPLKPADRAAFDRHKMARLQLGIMALREHISAKTRMVLTQFPTEGGALDVGMSEEAFADYVFDSVDQDWAEVGARQQRIIDSVLRDASEISIKGEDTDLTLSVCGRTFFNLDGRVNMPDGEIMVSPVENSINGYIAYSYPAIFPPGGRPVDGIRLWFEEGRVVKATATDGQDHLEAMLDLDPGARYVGEFAFGTNDRLDRWIGNILYDEKMGGTIHLAVGQSIGWPGGGVNTSLLHWDMIKDLRHGGEVWVDETLIQKDGRWVF